MKYSNAMSYQTRRENFWSGDFGDSYTDPNRGAQHKAVLPYRRYQERFFKRYYAGEMLDRFPDLTLRAYGFCYRRDTMFPLDDIS